MNRSGSVVISTERGSVSVTTWDRAEVGYEVTLEPAESDSVLYEEPTVDHSIQSVSFGDDTWSFRIPGLLTISPDGNSDPVAHYRVVMPATATLEIDDHASTIEVSGLEADVEIDTHEGEVSVNSMSGLLELETHAGTIEATALRGGIELETHSGNATVSFDEFSTPSEADTHSGTLRFFLPADTGFQFTTDLSTAELSVSDAFDPPSENVESRTFNGGGPELYIEAFSGEVEVRSLASRDASSP